LCSDIFDAQPSEDLVREKKQEELGFPLSGGVKTLKYILKKTLKYNI
jgi:hypothetical protein